jgi:predicted ATPase/class 3 adenylate cyclase
MTDRPRGTVTFLFTDIEGSTKLWERHPEAMKVALARHDALLRHAIESHRGFVFRTVGDAFYAAFPTAPEALAAALTAQRALRAEEWGETHIKARMALHTGSVEEPDGDYFGRPLNRVARLLAAGYGEQTLLSLATAELLSDDLPQDASLRDLGERRLKDLDRSERIFQLIVPDLPSDFPPLKTLDTLPNNLPIQLTRFIGREHVMAEVKRLLSASRLLTLTGAGGCGKTRLALQVAADVVDAEHFTQGAWLVELVSLSEPALVPQSFATALGLREEKGRTILAALTNHLIDKNLLLVLDNCEHLIDACAQLVNVLLRSCPKITILATSREALGIAGETAYRVPSLSLPDTKRSMTIEALTQYEAVRLFVDRAATIQPSFTVTHHNAPAVAQICHRLDGIPLAIELAAARVKVLSVDQIAQRLDDRFRLLTGGSRTALPRQQTLQALIDWSYDLLSERERALLRRLSAFAGGWTLEAAESICVGDGIGTGEILDVMTRLVDKSLVVVEELDGVARYRMLETIRQYARDRLLESRESADYRGKHLDWYLNLAEETDQKLYGAEQLKWLNRLDAEHENLRIALAWSLETAAEKGLRLGVALSDFWTMRGYWFEAGEWLTKLLALPDGAQARVPRAKALAAAAFRANAQGNIARARAMLEESLGIWRQLGNQIGIAQTLDELGYLALNENDCERATTFHKESLALSREPGHQAGIARALAGLGNVARAQNDWSKAASLYSESLVLRRGLGHKGEIVRLLWHLGRVAEYSGDYARAHGYFEESLATSREQGDTHLTAWSLRFLGHLMRGIGNYPRAGSLFDESLGLVREMRDTHCIAHSLTGLARIAHSLGDDERAASFAEEALTSYREVGQKLGIAEAEYILGVVTLAREDCEKAARCLGESLTLRRQTDYMTGISAIAYRHLDGIAECFDGIAAIAAAQSKAEHAARLFGAAESLRDSTKMSLTPTYRDERDRKVAAVRAQLDEATFNAAWNEGRAMTMEEAVAYALGAGSRGLSAKK